MKTITLALSILSLLSISAIAEDAADFVSQEKTYRVCLSDGQVFYGVGFQKWRSGTNWAHISYKSKSRPAAPQRPSLLRRRGTFSAWISFSQVTSIHEVKPSEEAAGEASDTSEAKAVTPDVHIPGIDTEGDESSEDTNSADESGQTEVQWFPEEPVGFGEGSDAVVVIGVVGAETEDDHVQGGLEAVAVGALVGGEAGAAIGAIQKPDHVIQGAWEYKMNDRIRAIKIISDGRWDLTHFDRTAGNVVVNHGGSYTFDGERYVEHVEYANETTADLVGQKHTFELTIEGDVLHQKGVENPWTEDWVRVKR